jgi:hypothetical protein
MRQYNNCRFCKKSTLESSNDMVKYGTRHYAHFRCYLDAGKTLDQLSVWKVGLFPYFLLKEKGLLDHPQVKAAQQLIGPTPGNVFDQRNADKIDGYDRDDLGESPDY